MNYTIGNNLREVPEDWEEFEKGIISLEEKLANTKTNLEKTQYLSKLGTLNRIVGRLEISFKQLTDTQLIIRNLDNEKLYIVNEIRLATTLQFQGKFEAAEQIHTALAMSSPNYELWILNEWMILNRILFFIDN